MHLVRGLTVAIQVILLVSLPASLNISRKNLSQPLSLYSIPVLAHLC